MTDAEITQEFERLGRQAVRLSAHVQFAVVAARRRGNQTQACAFESMQHCLGNFLECARVKSEHIARLKKSRALADPYALAR